MFRKSKRKIVAAIMAVLILLLAGTFGIIYLASYADMTKENRELLKEYVASYSLMDETDGLKPGKEEPGRTAETEDARGKGGSDRHPQPPPALELSTFYSVAVSLEGEILKVDTADVAALDQEDLVQLALEIIEKGNSSGVERNLIYRMEEKKDYILVAFLDNTLMLKKAGTLIEYTWIFGGITLVALFFLARFLAEKIVAPLEESYQRQKQFISDAGHELKTPVAVVNANVELLGRQIGENQWLANIRYENERMSALILQLLELAKTENVTPPMERVDYGHLVCGEALPFESVAYEKGIRLVTDIEEDICVWGNPGQLKQLVSILTDNAIRHSRRGNCVRLTVKKEKNSAILSVKNQGEEIPPEQRKHLFERFYRTDTARSGEDGHYGLGLAIAKAICTAHKGSIGVCCHQQEVEFTAKLPLHRNFGR